MMFKYMELQGDTMEEEEDEEERERKEREEKKRKGKETDKQTYLM